MKYSYRDMPESMKGTYGEFSKNFGFDWKEFVMGIPTPLFLVTTYKSNGQPNACMQCFLQVKNPYCCRDVSLKLQREIPHYCICLPDTL